jgi:peptidoglycan hydrolase-like protein with peptidoglycan-binding domain
MRKRITLLLASLLALVSLMGMSFADSSYFDASAYKKGDESRDVKLIQLALYIDGSYSGTEFATTFGPKTETAVKAFQKKYGLTADGVVGEGTMSKMASLGILPLLTETSYRNEDEGNEIQFIQMALMEEGYLNIDQPTTSFGPKTTAAVKAFQKANGLESDGIVGNDTIGKFVSLGYIKTSAQTAIDEENLSDDIAYADGNEDNVRYIGEVSRTSYAQGDNSADIALIQEALACMGYLEADTYTTYYGEDTTQAVKALQSHYGLTVDGVIGSGTFSVFKELGMLTVKSTEVVSRGATRYGEYLDWFKEVLPMAEAIYGADYRGKIKIVIEDFYTGVKINALFSYGHNHMDIEPLTKEDTEKIKKLWNYNYAWTMRPVLVYYLDHVVAASLAGMPHAASTLDRIGDNGMAGVLDLHFKNSRTHATNKIDERHQKQVRIAAGIE